jgi:hypothetical protein
MKPIKLCRNGQVKLPIIAIITIFKPNTFTWDKPPKGLSEITAREK